LTPEEARRAIDPRRLAIARDLESRRLEGWTEPQIAERRDMLLARLAAIIAEERKESGCEQQSDREA
jgi:hypothetical protein